MRVVLIVFGCAIAAVLGAVALSALFPGAELGASKDEQRDIERESVDGTSVLAATMQDGSSLWLYTIDAGEDHNYNVAMRGCTTLRRHLVPRGTVKVVDAMAARRDEFKELKTVFCK